jgi:hypothetical protein
MQFMWADTLEALERAHLLRTIVWGAASILAGTALVAWLKARHRQSGLLRHFAYQCAGWGVAEVLVGAALLMRVAPRDLSAATRLDRILWLNIGLDGGYVLTGVVIAVVGWRIARSLSAVGGGLGLIVQGLALALLDLVFAVQISR